MVSEEEILGAFVSNKCGHCVQFKKDFAKEIKDGKIELLKVDDEKGNPTEWMDVAAKHGVRGVPHLAKLKKNGNGKIKPDNIEISGACDIEEYRKTGSCKGKYPFV